MRQGAQGWCTGMTLRDGMGREVGGRVRMGNTCTPMADSCECMTPLFVGPLTEVIQHSSAWHSDPSSPSYLPDTKSPCRQWVLCLVTQSCPTLCNPMDCSHGILQARILEWVAIPFSRGSSQCKDWTQVSGIAGRFFTIWAPREAQIVSKTTANLKSRMISKKDFSWMAVRWKRYVTSMSWASEGIQITWQCFSSLLTASLLAQLTPEHRVVCLACCPQVQGQTHWLNRWMNAFSRCLSC